MAHAVGRAHLAYYRRLEARGEIAIVTDGATLDKAATGGRAASAEGDRGAGGGGGGDRRSRLYEEGERDRRSRLYQEGERDRRPRLCSATVGVILTLEGADPVTHPDELHEWHTLGVRSLMLAHFGQSRYAHGTPGNTPLNDDPSNSHDRDGPLTALGRELLPIMAELDMPLDLTHLSDMSFHEALDHFAGPVYSSHSACRWICPTAGAGGQRNHTDEQVRLIAERGGVVGVPLYNAFLEPDYRPDSKKQHATLDRVVDHLDHLIQLTGSASHAAIGSDLDGGFGIEHTPREIDSIADLHRLGDAMTRRGYGDADVEAVMGGNWVRFWREHLP